MRRWGSSRTTKRFAWGPGRTPGVSTVKIPPVLRSSTGGAKEVDAEGSSVGDVLRAVAEQHPATKSQLFSESGELNRYVNVYLNDEDVRVLDGIDTAVRPEDTLVILPAMAGGAR
jgi:molybdopterin synthase sulfur carrier subunit